MEANDLSFAGGLLHELAVCGESVCTCEGTGRLRPLVYLGQISGYAYHIHEMIMRWIRYYFPVMYRNVPNLLALALITMALTVALTKLWIRITAALRERQSLNDGPGREDNTRINSGAHIKKL